ncbi:MAG: TlpA disulfide reductase family protein [Verrucomicrobiota bacterium]
MKSLIRLVVTCAAFALPGSLHAATAAVTVGSPAPPIVNAAYIRGEPVKSFEPGKVYMVEFWATWCGPCVASIPHINDLHRKFADKGFIVIGQNISEPDLTLVEPFLKEMGDKMTYRVALDDTQGSEKGKMMDTWMKAAGIKSIPNAFLIGKDQKIAWIGHPLELKEETVEAVLAGTFDVPAFAKKYAEQAALDEKISTLLSSTRLKITVSDWEAANRDIEELTKLTAESQPFMPDLLRLEMACKRADLPAATALTKKFAIDQAKSASLVAHACALLEGAAKGDRPTLEVADKILSDIAAAQEKKGVSLLVQQARVKKALGKTEEAVTLAGQAMAAAPEKARPAVKKSLEGVLPADAP